MSNTYEIPALCTLILLGFQGGWLWFGLSPVARSRLSGAVTLAWAWVCSLSCLLLRVLRSMLTERWGGPLGRLAAVVVAGLTCFAEF